jgi:hypothetical protein
MPNTTGFDIQVYDQDDQQVTLHGAYRGHDALIVQVEVDKGPAPVAVEDQKTVIAAALLGMLLARPVNLIAPDVWNEIDRMGYEIRGKSNE